VVVVVVVVDCSSKNATIAFESIWKQYLGEEYLLDIIVDFVRYGVELVTQCNMNSLYSDKKTAPYRE
jgi:hypothetical protein